mmetsp:Transcript_61972/g.178396  ORF Transcript_61972/g.178396 Transcript_61972/m.178396 type:complete len:253 (-) Transcript_61972:10-768(-)
MTRPPSHGPRDPRARRRGPHRARATAGHREAGPRGVLLDAVGRRPWRLGAVPHLLGRRAEAVPRGLDLRWRPRVVSRGAGGLRAAVVVQPRRHRPLLALDAHEPPPRVGAGARHPRPARRWAQGASARRALEGVLLHNVRRFLRLVVARSWRAVAHRRVARRVGEVGARRGGRRRGVCARARHLGVRVVHLAHDGVPRRRAVIGEAGEAAAEVQLGRGMRRRERRLRQRRRHAGEGEVRGGPMRRRKHQTNP